MRAADPYRDTKPTNHPQTDDHDAKTDGDYPQTDVGYAKTDGDYGQPVADDEGQLRKFTFVEGNPDPDADSDGDVQSRGYANQNHLLGQQNRIQGESVRVGHADELVGHPDTHGHQHSDDNRGHHQFAQRRSGAVTDHTGQPLRQGRVCAGE
jgi:hypothetical protein